MPADIATTLAGWLSTSASNAPTGGTSVSSNLDDNIREIMGVIVRGLSHKGADIPSATTTDLGAVEGLFHDITGVTTITGFGTVRAGIWKVLKYEGALTLTHNATSLILLGGASRTTAAGDVQIVASEGSGNWREWAFFRAASLYIASSTTDTLTNKDISSSTNTYRAASDTETGAIEIATQAEIETGTDTTRAVTPGRQHFQPSAAKAWVKWNSAGTVLAGYNVASVTVNSTGNYTINFTTAFSSADYSCSLATSDAASCVVGMIVTQSVGSTNVIFRNSSNVPSDGAGTFTAAFFGDL